MPELTAVRPIIFSAPMVLALLAGRKTQTRRLAWKRKHAPIPFDNADEWMDLGWSVSQPDDTDTCIAWIDRPTPWQKVKHGERLWVRETWGIGSHPVICCKDALPNWCQPGGFCSPVYHRASCEGMAWGMYGPPKWRSPIHMQRRSSRLTLTVTDVRVQMLQDITDQDARAEGCISFGPYPGEDADVPTGGADDAFRMLWDELHGAGAWDANPEVVALTFTVERRNVDA